MEQSRVRIVDIAQTLGLSTATVSNVLHGKTEKLSGETVKRVQQELERTGYIPNMAGILLARNNSRIIGVVVNDHAKYEGRVLEDGFVMSSLNALSREVNEKGYFLMVKTTAEIRDIPVFASMWNMDGLILMGFCEADYETLRAQIHISFVVYDGYFSACSKVVNLGIDHYGGGCQAGRHFRELGHTKALCIADNAVCMDKERIDGFRSGGRTKIILVIDCLGTWCVGIPLCLLAAYGLRWGIVGVYALLNAEEAFRLVLSLVMFRRRSWMVSLSEKQRVP